MARLPPHPATGAGCIREDIELSFRGAPWREPQMRNCASGNLEMVSSRFRVRGSASPRNDDGGLVLAMGRELPESTTTPHSMQRDLTRRRLLKSTVAGLSAAALPGSARAQLAAQPPPKRAARDEFSVTAPTAIEVNARPIAAFDPRDPQRKRFGALEYRSALVLTSRFPGSGGLPAGRCLDGPTERFVPVSRRRPS